MIFKITLLVVLQFYSTSLCNGQQSQEQVSMTMLLKGQFSSDLPNTEYQCYVSNSDGMSRVQSLRKVNTRNPADRGTIEGVNNPAPPEPVPVSGSNPHWRVDLYERSNRDFGVFGCTATQDGRRETEILGIFMRSDADIVPMDDLFTKTVSLGDSGVSIGMIGRKSGIQFRWLHNNNREDNFNNLDSLSIRRTVTVADAGVYECHNHNRRDQAKQGLKLLIVRACPRNTWGRLCAETCEPCYNGGVCDEVTGNCICAPGFQGSDCSDACGGNRFGYSCEFRCTARNDPADACERYLFCLPHPYGCTCNTGFKGLDCNETCSRGTYGASCLGSCHCRSGECDSYTGSCMGSPSGCSAGWTGTNCQQACDRGTFGMGCSETCHCQSGDCNKQTGRCRGGCALGWQGTSCDQVCDPGTFGMGCSQTCHCRSGDCNKQTGRCTGGCALGWKGTSCDQACDRGTFGMGCSETCHCQSGDCNKQTGRCRGGCALGWQGTSCDQVCDLGTFGMGCSQTCHCRSGDCNKQTGRCTGGCALGWKGTSCDQACDRGTFGMGCSETCHCQSGDCNKQTGRCRGGCALGWKGTSCDQACDPGTFGMGCSETCHCRSGDCNKQTGRCTGGCSPGWKGSSCDQALPKLNSPPMKSSVQAFSITIHWSSWRYKTDRDGYMPFYKNASDGEWIAGSNKAINGLTFTFTNLTSETTYSFSVAIVSDGNEGLKSPNLNVTTSCPVPSSPTNVTAELGGENKDRLKISWMIPVSASKCSSGVSRVTLYYSRLHETESEMTENITDSSRTFHILSDKVEEVTYMIQMSLTTAGGESVRSFPIFHSITCAASGGDHSSISNNSQTTEHDTSILSNIVLSCIVVALVIYIILFTLCKNRSGGLHHWKNIFNAGGKTSAQKLPRSASGRKYAQNGDMAVSFPSPDSKEEVVMEDLHEFMDMPCVTAEPVYSNTERPVPILKREFEKYVRKCESSDSGTYEMQFQLFKPGKQYECEVGEKEVNKAKNRFKNMLAYDHSRVILEKLEGDPHSDYYNANYIENVFGVLSYIASQGPNTASLDDFWRVIWQENVSNVVMLTKLVERGKNRCKQYWPKAIGVSQSYGGYLVTWDSKQEYADYVIRYLRIKCIKGDETREVANWHFLSWQDMGVPSHPTPLIEMARKIKVHQDTLTSPLLVHCSAGVGRTGTFIALCALMDIILTRERVDIFGFVEQMRQSRIMMVQTAEQYKFLHECLLEFYLTGCTEISATDISSFSVHDNEEKLLREYALLSKLVRPSKDHHKTAPEEVEKSRFPSLLPVESKRPYIETKSHSSHYINACLTSSLTQQDAYIATQSPLPTTVEDFWALVHGWKCPIIVMLNPLDPTDATCCKYWPDGSCPLEVGHVTIELTCEEDRGFYIYRTFNMTQKYNKKQMEIHQLQLKSWDVERPHDILQLIVQLERLEEVLTFKGPPIVHCINGVGSTGVFLATKSEMERLRLENRVDVFSTVLQLRESNPNFIITQDDYNLCHLLMKMETPESAYGNI